MTSLVLGTAQFGLDYGATNKNGIVEIDNISAILSQSQSFNINSLDTAQTYGSSEKILGKFNLSNFKVNTKLLISPVEPQPFNSLINQVKSSLTNLNISKIGTLFIHNPQALNKENLDTYSYQFLKLKEMDLIESIGVSVYSYKDVKRLFNYFPIDVVQAPFNIFDSSFFSSGWLKILSSESIHFQARSIFLQGVLICKNSDLPIYFDQFSQYFQILDKISRDTQLTKLEIVFAFLNQFPSIDSIVFGVENLSQLETIYKNFAKDYSGYKIDLKLFDAFSSTPAELVDPRLWKINER